MVKKKSVILVMCSSVLACSGGAGTDIDGGLVDGSLVDGGLVDGGLVDGGLVDGSLVDGGLVDGGLVDSGLVDGGPAVCSKMDILFVIDDSGSMAEEQQNLVQNLPMFLTGLNSINDGNLDYHLAVTTTGRDTTYTIEILSPPVSIDLKDVGDNGVFRQECGMTKRWLERTDTPSDTFPCVAAVGTKGPALEMPLYSTQLALSDRIQDGTNAGFLREDALLGIVILTDEDDCSRTDNGFTLIDSDQCEPLDPAYLPTGTTIEFLDTLKGRRSNWASVVIAAPTDCSSVFGDASAANRLQSFVAEAGDNSVFSSICSGNLLTPLLDAVSRLETACLEK